MNDSHTNTVYIAEALRRYPDVFKRITEQLTMNGIDVHIISGTKNVWCRDWMPVQTPGGFVKFTYKGYGMLEKYPQLRVDEHCWGDFADAFRSDIILDGGNVVRWGDRVLMTDIVFTHNPGYDRTLLRDTLSDLLEAEIIFLPVEPGDTLGHTDGIVRWIDQGAVLLNYYLCMCGPEKVDYWMEVSEILGDNGIRSVPMTCGCQYEPEMTEEQFRKEYPEADDFNSAVGYYCNFLQVKGLILYPTFDLWMDLEAEERLAATFPDVTIRAVDCSRLAMEGGCVNCVTANYVMPEKPA